MSRRRPTAREHGILGAYFFHRGAYDLAIRELRAAVRLAPLSGGAYHNLGAAYLARRRYAEAEEAFRRVLDLAPGQRKTRLLLGLTLAGQGRATEAQATFEALLADDPPDELAREARRELAALCGASPVKLKEA